MKTEKKTDLLSEHAPYIAPACEVILMELEGIIAASSDGTLQKFENGDF